MNAFNLTAHELTVSEVHRLASNLTAKGGSSQPAQKTGALPRAVSQSSPFIKAANACAPDRGVEAILANHGCSRSVPAPYTPDAASSADEVPCNKWEMFALLSFVFSFAALFFCFYVVLAKCRGTWPL
jgi:hypothetical protein